MDAHVDFKERICQFLIDVARPEKCQNRERERAMKSFPLFGIMAPAWRDDFRADIRKDKNQVLSALKNPGSKF